MLDSLATTADAASYGYDAATEPMLARASARIRAFLGRSDPPTSDALVELTCQVANRLARAAPELEEGVQSASDGPFTRSYGVDAWKAQAGLTQGEQAALRRLLPATPRLIVMGPTTAPGG